MPLYGKQNASNYLAAVTVGLKLGLTKKQIESGTKKLIAVDKRLNVKKFKDFILVDDTYNANPESMKYALQFLSKFKSYKRKIAVLGDMFELGKEEIDLHIKLASFVFNNKITEVYTIGKRMKNLSDMIDGAKIIKKHFGRRDNLKFFLRNMDISNSVVLVKGSRGMKMEEFVDILETKLL